MTLPMRVLTWVLAVGLGFPAVLSAQYGNFGQNKIQYHRFDWRVLHGEHVDLYYYPAAEDLGRVALTYAEESYDSLSRRFNHVVTKRIPLIVYASHNDFEQTNVLPFIPPEGLLGVTEFLRRRVALPFRGSYAEFRHTIRHELVHVFQLSMVSQTFGRHPRFRQVGMPLWWTEGMAEFFSAGEDSRDEMILRDMTIDGHLPSLPELYYASGGLVYPIGGSIHRFLAERYGEWRILDLYNEIWKYRTFDAALAGVYGRSIADLSEEWLYWMRQHYYPAVVAQSPLALTARKLSDLAVKPTAYLLPGDSALSFLFFSPARGYTTIYAQNFVDHSRRSVVQGERSQQFESFHFFESRMDVNAQGIAVFTSKNADRDALFLWDLRKSKVIAHYQFAELVSMLSPAWAPDGKSVVFSGLSESGYSDLYRYWIADPGDSLGAGRLERLTSDRYEDLDPTVSPDGQTVVFSSDRTPFGKSGARNLFALDLATGAIRYLTYGDWRDESPRFGKGEGGEAGDRIYFASDRDGIFQIYSVDSTGAGRRETRTVNGAFDPQWVPPGPHGGGGGLLFDGFADLSFNIYLAPPLHDAARAESFALATDSLPAPSWIWDELSQHSQYASTDATPYSRRFSLDFAAGDAAVAPGVGSAQGAMVVFSDLLSDHQLYLSVSSFQSSDVGSLLDNVSGSAFYLNQSRRINWGVGAFRQRGLFYEGDYNSLYREESYGLTAQVRYPLNRFRRLVGEYRFERSDRLDLNDNLANPHRVGWLASNYLSYVKDNTLWLDTGPIDGERYNVTAGVVTDLSHSRFDSWVLSADWRKYIRTAQRSAVALRVEGFTSGGERPQQISIGGSWGLRGYPQYGYVAGTRAWLVNAEYRFPVLDFLTVGFPFGSARFPGIQAALFVDYGRAWTTSTEIRHVLGASGLGLRMPIGPPLVLRLDFGYRLGTVDVPGYHLPASTNRQRFVDFFFGFNY